MVAIVHSPRRPTILVALVAALGLAGAAHLTHRHRHSRAIGEPYPPMSLRDAHHRCRVDHRISDAQKLRDVQTRIESGRDDNPPRAER